MRYLELLSSVLKVCNRRKAHDTKDAAVVAEIDFEEVMTEAGNISMELKDLGKCKLNVYDGERDIPHFHIDSTKKDFHACVRIDKPDYFIHKHYKDKLNSTQKKVLINALNQKQDFREKEMRIWDIICILWDAMNPTKQVGEIEMPDYDKLPDKD